MRFYSDELKRVFDTEAELLAAEETARIAAEEKKETKAKLAKAVDDADKALNIAYAGLEDAKKKVLALQEEYNKKVDSIMDPALDAIKECNKARTEAIRKFNEKFGAYTVTYTGNKALDEFAKIENTINQLWKKFYW